MRPAGTDRWICVGTSSAKYSCPRRIFPRPPKVCIFTKIHRSDGCKDCDESAMLIAILRPVNAAFGP